jgi:chitinase
MSSCTSTSWCPDIAIMSYDIWGSSSASVGPNAPLDDSCAPTQAGSATSAVNAWTNAKFPPDQVWKYFSSDYMLTFGCGGQIVLGVPAYGHSFYVTPANALNSTGQLAAYPPFDASKQPAGDKDDGKAGKQFQLDGISRRITTMNE